MRDEQDGYRVLQPHSLQVEIHLVPGQCIECSEGLVHQQQPRAMHQRAAQRHALAHAAGEFEWMLALEAFEPDRS